MVIGMFCVYEWDDRRELVMVTVADGFGLRWYQVMTWVQWQEVVDLAEVTG